MNRSFRRLAPVLAAACLVAVACGSDDDSSDDPDPADTATDVTDAPAAGAEDAAEEAGDASATTGAEAGADGAAAPSGLQVTMVSFADSTAVLTNAGDEPVDLTGHWVCNRPGYSELPAMELAAGESVEISMGVSEGGGEVAIYSSAVFDSSDDLLAYVQWGSGGGRSSVAEAAGLWSGPPVEPAADGIELVGDPGSADGWT